MGPPVQRDPLPSPRRAATLLHQTNDVSPSAGEGNGKTGDSFFGDVRVKSGSYNPQVEEYHPEALGKPILDDRNSCDAVNSAFDAGSSAPNRKFRNRKFCNYKSCMGVGAFIAYQCVHVIACFPIGVALP